MFPDLRVQRAPSSRLDEVDFENLGFGDVFSDHMFSLRYRDGRWGSPEILPYGPVSVDPSNATLHYGQSVFEGLKAFRGVDGQARLFRPDRNARRLRDSCERLCIPLPDEEVLLSAIDHLVRMDHHWIPSGRGQALYIRPLIFSDEGQLEVRPSSRYRLLIMTAPVRAYFDVDMTAVSLGVEDRFTRSAPGGTGFAKTAGNYAASLYPTEQARASGHAQVLWLDGIEHRFVEEVGAMNIFFRIDGVVVTPDLHGTILPGITRDSVITLLQDSGQPVEERRISIDEVIDAARAGRLQEAFGAGTAAIIAPVGSIAYRGEKVAINDGAAGSLTRELYDRITGIQLGEIEDVHGWNRVVELDQATGRLATG
jgi:branched-chain amino acid aminotransferase